VFYTDDQVLNLDDIIQNNNQTVKVPNEMSLRAHWLAIDGVQPSIPENPEIVSKEAQKKEIVEGQVIKQKEKQKKLENVKVKQIVSHDLSLEHQLYFKAITEACVGMNEVKRKEALYSLSTDPGIHQLLPRLSLFISEGVRLNIAQTNLPMLYCLMRMVCSLAENKHVYLDKYLHEIFPSVISCILSKQLCSKPEADSNWKLRDYSARIIGVLVKNFCNTMPSLQTRIIKIFLNAMQTERNATFATVFGAIDALSEIGTHVFENFVFPLIKKIGERVTQVLDSPASSFEEKSAIMLRDLITKSACNVLKTKPASHEELDQLTTDFGAYFGQIIHTNLNNIRNEEAKKLAASTHHKTTVIHPPTGRIQAQHLKIHSPQPLSASSAPNTPTTQKIIKYTSIIPGKGPQTPQAQVGKMQLISQPSTPTTPLSSQNVFQTQLSNNNNNDLL